MYMFKKRISMAKNGIRTKSPTAPLPQAEYLNWKWATDRLVIEDSDFGRSYAKRTIFNRVHFEKQDIKEVYIRTSKGLELLYKKESGLTKAIPLSPNP